MDVSETPRSPPLVFFGRVNQPLGLRVGILSRHPRRHNDAWSHGQHLLREGAGSGTEEGTDVKEIG